MQLDKIKMSRRSQSLLGILKHKTSLPINVLSRFAICISLNDKITPNPDIYPEDGMELLPHILFGKYNKIFTILMTSRLRSEKLDPLIYLNPMFRAHLNRGASLLKPRISDMGDFQNLVVDSQK